MTSMVAIAGRAKVVAWVNKVAVAMDVVVTAAGADAIMNGVHMQTMSTSLTLTGNFTSDE